MNKVVQMLLGLTSIGIISGGLLAVVSDWADPFIAANQKAATEAAIFRVKPEGKKYEQIKNAGFELYKVMNENDQNSGYALVYEGNGFSGKIRLIAGLSEDLNNISAIEVLDQVETPGLGTKIVEEPFTSQFLKLETTPKIDWVKGEKPDKANEIQTITGATISSKAVVAILNDGISRLKKLRESGGLK
jgi:electron transport complex protein RnfG